MLWRFLRSILFHLDPEWAHGIACVYLQWRGLSTQGRVRSVRRAGRWELAGQILDSPLGVAAGFDKDGKYVLGLRSLGFGFVEVGSVTPIAQKGNPRPRLFRLPQSQALINRMGFNSEGAESVAYRLERLRALTPVQFPIGVNLGKNRETPLERAVDDYLLGLDALYAVADYLVINLSSPNTPGLTRLQEGEHLAPLLNGLRARRELLADRLPGTKRPLLLKISPDLTPEARKTAIEAAMAANFDGIIASNTSRRRDFSAISKDDDPALLKEEGGLSGLPLQAESVASVAEIRKLMGPKATLISVGGVFGADDVKQRLDLGANLVQVYTGFLYQGPGFPAQVQRELT